ncbi:MAG: alpha/beta hydrolase domain-containing protein [Pseudohongiellaceae bacterium]|nr:alpha/beta hydrolase domain-containing protein [Pseudohongiellaceae bacterium]
MRYEVIVNSDSNDVNIAGGAHLAYAPTEAGLENATLSQRSNQADPRQAIAPDRFSLNVEAVEGSSQYLVTLHLEGGLKAGEIYELIYEAKDPVLSGAGLAGIRDAVSLLRYGTDNEALNAQLADLELPELNNSVSWGVSQSGRLLRQFLYQGFNQDLEGRPVFDGVLPVIAGGGFGMFNVRFAMPTRTNGQHENHLYPNDYFPFTYGDSVNPFTGQTDGILRQARLTNTEPKLMHIQTSNEYWIRAGSLVHTDPLGTSDAPIPDNVRIYSIGGSQHGSGTGTARAASSGQLPANPNRWTPISETLLQALIEWVAEDKKPPASRYPKIADSSLVASHLSDGTINSAAWRPMPSYSHPKAMYQVAHVSFGENFLKDGIIDIHSSSAEHFYKALVPAVNEDNNDSATSTILPPLTQVPLASFLPWNLRALETGAPTELARLTGAYIPFSQTETLAKQAQDPRASIEQRYSSFDEYIELYEAATDRLIAEGYLLPGYKDEYMEMGQANEALFN